jgi:hypothetical protein
MNLLDEIFNEKCEKYEKQLLSQLEELGKQNVENNIRTYVNIQTFGLCREYVKEILKKYDTNNCHLVYNDTIIFILKKIDPSNNVSTARVVYDDKTIDYIYDVVYNASLNEIEKSIEKAIQSTRNSSLMEFCIKFNASTYPFLSISKTVNSIAKKYETETMMLECSYISDYEYNGDYTDYENYTDDCKHFISLKVRGKIVNKKSKIFC